MAFAKFIATRLPKLNQPNKQKLLKFPGLKKQASNKAQFHYEYL